LILTRMSSDARSSALLKFRSGSGQYYLSPMPLLNHAHRYGVASAQLYLRQYITSVRPICGHGVATNSAGIGLVGVGPL
jgi:hypothetical protein